VNPGDKKCSMRAFTTARASLPCEFRTHAYNGGHTRASASGASAQFLSGRSATRVELRLAALKLNMR
jgi:hypothetical protein